MSGALVLRVLAARRAPISDVEIMHGECVRWTLSQSDAGLVFAVAGDGWVEVTTVTPRQALSILERIGQ